MTPVEYVNDLCDPGDPPGYLLCQVSEDAAGLGWSIDQLQEAKNLIIDRYQKSPRFMFPQKVRYI